MKPILAVTFVVMFVGKDTGIPAFARGDSDNMTEERIAHILSEASQMMKTQVEDSHSNDSKSPNQGQVRYVNLHSHIILIPTSQTPAALSQFSIATLK